MMIARVGVAAMAAALLSVPASAAFVLVTATGQTNPGSGPPGNTLAGVPFGTQFVVANFLFDTSVAGSPIAPVGGTGTGTRFAGSVVGFWLTVGPWTVTQTENSIRAAFLFDNGSPSLANPALRFDQFSLSDGFTFDGPTFLPHLATDATLEEGVFLSSLNFGRSQTAVGSDPTMVTGTAYPDLVALFNGPGAYFLTMNFRRGTPQSAAELAALPQVTFATAFSLVRAEEVVLPAVPEPATWALLIAGFGLVGTALRRRAATPAPR